MVQLTQYRTAGSISGHMFLSAELTKYGSTGGSISGHMVLSAELTKHGSTDTV